MNEKDTFKKESIYLIFLDSNSHEYINRTIESIPNALNNDDELAVQIDINAFYTEYEYISKLIPDTYTQFYEENNPLLLELSQLSTSLTNYSNTYLNDNYQNIKKVRKDILDRFARIDEYHKQGIRYYERITNLMLRY